MFSDYKYRPTGSFKADVPKTDFKGCLNYFIILVLVTTIIIGLSIYFGWD